MPDAKREPASIVLHPMSEAPRDDRRIIAMHIEGDKPRMKIVRWSTNYSIHGLGGHWTEAGIGGQYGDMHFAGWLPIETDMEWPSDKAAATFAGAGGEPVKCRRCSDCEGASHHWIPDPQTPDGDDFEPGDYACKHCPQRGDGCEVCPGDGYLEGDEGNLCQACGAEGVVAIPVADITARIILERWEQWDLEAGQAAQAEQSDAAYVGAMVARIKPYLSPPDAPRGNCPDCGGTGGYQPAYVAGGEIVGPDACATCQGHGDVPTPPAPPAAPAEGPIVVGGLRCVFVEEENVFDERVWRIHGLRSSPLTQCQMPVYLDHKGRWRAIGSIGAATLLDWPTESAAREFAAKCAKEEE